MDLFASLDSGGSVRFRFDAGLRFVPEGRLVKASCTVAAKLRRLVAEAGVQTDGWGVPGEISLDSLGYFLGANASLR